MVEVCCRCEAVLPPVEGESPAYCWQCGLPQLRVAEAVLEAAETRAAAATVAGSPAGLSVNERELDWPVMLRILLGATALGLLPCVVLRGSLFTGSVGVLVLFLLPVLCLGSGFAYARRRPMRKLTAGNGAQMGLALGTMLAFAVTTVTAVAGFALRYGRHNGSLQQIFDGVMQQAEAQVRATQPGAADNVVLAMRLPEWHAGFFLLMQGAIMLLLIVCGAAAGLVAGAMLGARQAAMRKAM